MLTCTVGLLSEVRIWDGISIHHPQIPRPRNPIRAFLCYARVDEEFALKLAQVLKERGVPMWVDQWDIPGGVDWDKSIDDALSSCTHLLIVLSPEAISSHEVRAELRTALNQEKTIVPVL
jgi:hypothetical protein